VLVASFALGGCVGTTRQLKSATSMGTSTNGAPVTGATGTTAGAGDTAGSGTEGANSNPSSGSSSTSNSSSNTPAVQAAVLSASSLSVNFGSITIGSSTSQLISLTNTGNENLKISAVSVSGTGYTVSGGSNVTLTPSQSVTVSVNFEPSAAGVASGRLTVASNASNSNVQVAVSGTGVTTNAAVHSVDLSWTPAASAVGYSVYRSQLSGGPFAKLNTAADTKDTYTDSGLSSGTYYYVVTSIGNNSIESVYSNEAQVVVP